MLIYQKNTTVKHELDYNLYSFFFYYITNQTDFFTSLFFLIQV